MFFLFAPLPHEAARDRIADLPLLTRDVFDGLLPELKAYAFTITGLDRFDQLARIRDEIAAVPAGEATWAKAKQRIAADLSERLGGEEAVRRAELLLRTHTFRGYAVARYRTLMQQVDVFPYWQYKTHGDDRVRPSHAALNGKILPAGHPVWQRIFPPWDWGCRCLVVPMMGGEVERMKAGEQATVVEHQRVWDGNVADAIAAGERLPNGISILPSPTWGSSPWSEKGTLRHTWQLVQQRYANDPETLSAFIDWAQKTEIEKGMTVAHWLSGKPAKKPRAKRRAKVVPPVTPIINSGPRGTPLQGKLDADALTKKEQARVRATLAIIDSVHGDGPLQLLPVDNAPGRGNWGVFSSSSIDGTPLRIGYSKTSPHPELTLIHEVGHWIDKFGIGIGPTNTTGPRLLYASQDENLAGGKLEAWWAAVTQSDAWQRMLASGHQNLSYYRRGREAWARSYAQFIAEESQDATLLKQLSGELTSRPTWKHWTTKDFARIRAAMRLLFESEGWMNPVSAPP